MGRLRVPQACGPGDRPGGATESRRPPFPLDHGPPTHPQATPALPAGGRLSGRLESRRSVAVKVRKCHGPTLAKDALNIRHAETVLRAPEAERKAAGFGGKGRVTAHGQPTRGRKPGVAPEPLSTLRAESKCRAAGD